ncbi:MAG: hypothetical protein GY740_18465 [Gammaproteobacteria bacterium]|nr:hypothetical protein [Gammaproteobacteria bacterium]
MSLELGVLELDRQLLSWVGEPQMLLHAEGAPKLHKPHWCAPIVSPFDIPP